MNQKMMNAQNREEFLTDDMLHTALTTLLGWRQRETTLSDIGANHRLLAINVAIEAIHACIRSINKEGETDDGKVYC